MSTLQDRFTREDAKRIAAMECATETALMPLTVRRLCELIVELEQRVAALESKKQPSRLSRLLGRKEKVA